jgi:hypothetical protein
LAHKGFRGTVKQKSPGSFAKVAKLVGVILLLAGTGVYFAWYFGLLKKGETDLAAANAPPEKAAVDTNEAAAAAAPAPKLDQVIPPVYTLDVKTAKIPDGKANGMINGTNFVLDTARLERSGNSTILTLRQGAGVSADREVLVYLRVSPTESLTNRTFTVSSDTKFGAPTIVKRWKHDPRFAPQQRPYTGGYALKLETGNAEEDGSLNGKIYLALPDNEKTVVAGNFKALSTVVQAVAQPTAEGTESGAPQGGMDARMRQRYGVR